LPERFKLEYINEKGGESRPIMIHRAILGSVERFIGTLIEHYGGAFPVWLAPTQVIVIPIKEEHNAYAAKIKEDLQNKGLRGIIDQRNESLNKRIREGTVKKVPYLLIVGDKEVAGKKVAVRKYGKGDEGAQDVEAFIERVYDEVMSKKY